jgi:signal-transduction protein with cAMP-binding, CBS, and nucleotidyltransferase domain
MNERSVTVLFVVEDERPVGILHVHDLLAGRRRLTSAEPSPYQGASDALPSQ